MLVDKCRLDKDTYGCEPSKYGGTVWGWYGTDRRADADDLPLYIWKELNTSDVGSYFKWFRSKHDAESELRRALHKLSGTTR